MESKWWYIGLDCCHSLKKQMSDNRVILHFNDNLVIIPTKFRQPGCILLSVIIWFHNSVFICSILFGKTDFWSAFANRKWLWGIPHILYGGNSMGIPQNVIEGWSGGYLAAFILPWNLICVHFFTCAFILVRPPPDNSPVIQPISEGPCVTWLDLVTKMAASIRGVAAFVKTWRILPFYKWIKKSLC